MAASKEEFLTEKLVCFEPFGADWDNAVSANLELRLPGPVDQRGVGAGEPLGGRVL